MPQTINLSIEIPEALEEQLKSISNQQAFVVSAIRRKFASDPLDQCTSFEEVTSIITRNARKKGLTEDILN